MKLLSQQHKSEIDRSAWTDLTSRPTAFIVKDNLRFPWQFFSKINGKPTGGGVARSDILIARYLAMEGVYQLLQYVFA